MPRFFVPIAMVIMVVAAITALVFLPRWLPERGAESAAAGARSTRTVPVLVEPVVLRTRRVKLEAVGTARAEQSVTLFPAAAGEVVAVDFKAGQLVEAGTMLVELDRRTEALQLELAKVRLKEAERELARNTRISKSGAVSAAALEAARTAAALARLEVQRAEVALADRTVRAPFTGHIGITDVDVGDRIGPDTPIAPLDDRDRLLVSFEIPERFLPTLRVGDPIEVATWTADDSRAQGEIFHIGTRVDPQRRTFVARARVANPDDALRPGMSFRVTLLLEGRRLPVVPEVSLQWGDDGAYVWVLREGSPQRVPVTIVQRAEGRIMVDAPLEEGMRVVTEGVQSVREGSAVEVREAAPGAGEG